MIKKLLFVAVILFSASSNAQEIKEKNKAFDLLKNHTQTKILYDKVGAIAKLTDVQTKPLSSLDYKQAYHEIQRADFLERLPKIDFLETKIEKGFAENIAPISILISEFEAIKPSVRTQNQLQINANNQYEITDFSIDYFNIHKIGFASPLIKQLKGTQIAFKLSDELIFNTTTQTISKIEINFNTGKGFQKISSNQIISADFETLGSKTISFKITLNDGTVFTNESKFTLKEKAQNLSQLNKVAQQTPFAVSPLTEITSSLTYQGTNETAAHAGKGEFQIFYDNEAGLLDKVIIVCDGFDPADGRDTGAIYNLLNYGTPTQNLGDNVRNLGYDVVVLNFPIYTRPDGVTNIDGGVDYIQRNARVMIELINYINANKVGNQELVVIGPSMGGLITRMALRYMEMNGMNHKTRLWLSFDSPHLGANVPIGMQHMFNYLAYDPDISDLTVRAIVDSMLKSPAARQMLIDHFEGHLLGSSLTDFDQASAALLPTGHPTHRNVFQTELNTMGFPQNCRKIAISNGAGNGTMTGTPGMTVLSGLDVPNSDGFTRALLDLNFTPAANGNIRVSRVRKQAWTLFWLTIGTGQTNARSFAYTAGLDSAPGGMFNLESLAADAGPNPTLTRFLNAMTIKKFDFIPAQSSLAITSTNNWYANINASSTSAFDAYSVPTANEDHVTLTPSNVTFAMNEIVNNIQLKCPTSTTWNGTSWSNGLPSKDKQVAFTENYTSSSSIDACSISVSGTAIVNFLANHDLNVRGGITVAPTAQLKFASSANVYQIEEISNSGNIEFNRVTSLKRLDYVGWSAPVSNQNLLAFSPNTLTNRFYEYIPTGTTTPTAYNSVNPTTNNFATGKGYLIRAENTMPSTTTTWNGKFTGTPNNGRINPNVIYGGAVGLGFNLVGNPYPSPINIQEFIIGNLSKIDGTLHFWTNTNAAVSGTYIANNFASRNLTGGTAAMNGSLIPDEFIQTGQGFYVNALATGPMYFTNSMRNATSNNQFINRNINISTSTSTEKHRFWLNLSEGNNNHNQILLGYVENATNDLDFGYDGKILNNGNSAIYSLVNGNELVIQGKGLPFTDDDVIPLGFTTQNSGLFTISLGEKDGLFTNQSIYLKDNFTNSLIDLTQNNHTFIANAETINNRFEIVFKNNLSNNNQTEFDENSTIVFNENNSLTITSSTTKIKSIIAYDVLGRVLFEENHIQSNKFIIPNLKPTNNILLLTIIDENNIKVQKKVIF